MPLKRESNWEDKLREGRKAMKKALHRVEMAKKWASEGDKIDERLFSLDWQWNATMEDRMRKSASAKHLRK